MNKQELAKMLQNFDHYTQYSEDYSVVKRGIKQKEFILKMMDELFDKKSEALEFYNENTPDNVNYMQSYIDELKAEGN
jgi:hypothetical protein